jgi:hypothetical protein
MEKGGRREGLRLHCEGTRPGSGVRDGGGATCETFSRQEKSSWEEGRKKGGERKLERKEAGR